MWPRCKESAAVGHIERRIARKPRRQIGVSDEELAEGYRIRLSVSNDFVRLCESVFLVSMYTPPNCFLSWGPNLWGPKYSTRKQKTELAPA